MWCTSRPNTEYNSISEFKRSRMARLQEHVMQYADDTFLLCAEDEKAVTKKRDSMKKKCNLLTAELQPAYEF